MTDHVQPTGFIDIHCHILPGIDDGSDSIEESLEMADIARDDGVSHIFATPHIMAGAFDNDARGIMEAARAFRERLGNGLSILYGADVRVSVDLPDRVAKKEVPTLNGSPYLLIEFPSYAMPLHCGHLLFTLKQAGTVPILTHPERYPYFSGKLRQVKELKDDGALVQVTALSITGGFGKEIKKVVLSMIEKGLVDFVASDAHHATGRTPVLSRAYREVIRQFDEDTANRLFYQNPRMVLDSVPL